MSDQVETVDSASDERIVNNIMRHEYRVLTDAEKTLMSGIKDKALELHGILQTMGESRELEIAKMKVEECVMWAVKDLTK